MNPNTYVQMYMQFLSNVQNFSLSKPSDAEIEKFATHHITELSKIAISYGHISDVTIEENIAKLIKAIKDRI